MRETIEQIRAIGRSDPERLANAATNVLWAYAGGRLNHDAERILDDAGHDMLWEILNCIARRFDCDTAGDTMHFLNTQLRYFAGAELILGKI